MMPDLLSSVGWQHVLPAITALLAVCVVVLYVRVLRLGRAQPADRAGATPPGRPSAAAAPAIVRGSGPACAEDVPGPRVKSGAAAIPSGGAFAANEPPAAFSLSQIMDLERETAQLRKEVGSLRGEVLVLREEVKRAAGKGESARPGSALYEDAMEMSIQGHDAATIAQHCGISRAEADLVVALARNRDQRN